MKVTQMNNVAKDPAFAGSILLLVVFLCLIYLAGLHETVNVAGAWFLIQVLLLYPVLEEIVFRGLVQEELHRVFGETRLYGISGSNLVTSIMFVAFHMVHHEIVWALSVLIPSLLFGYFKDRYGSLMPPIFLHIVFNCGYFALLA